jgi:hypothetical protein
MYGIFTNIYPINDPNVGKYTRHGSYGSWISRISAYFNQETRVFVWLKRLKYGASIDLSRKLQIFSTWSGHGINLHGLAFPMFPLSIGGWFRV